MSDHSKRVICAIAGIVVLESIAMITGHNGTMLRLAMAAVAGLGGFSLAKFLTYRQQLPPPPPPPE